MSQTKAQLIDNLVQPITGALGSASAPTFSFTSDPNSGLYSPGADQVAISTGGFNRLFIDSSGRLLVGTSSSASAGNAQYALVQVRGNSFSTANNAILAIGRGEAATSITANEDIGNISFTDSAGNEFAEIKCSADANAGSGDYPGRLVFSTTADGEGSPTERMRIDSAGNWMYGVTTFSNASKGFLISGSSGRAFISCSGDTVLDINRLSSTGEAVAFRSSSTQVGSISVTGSATAYNTSSDYRLKENVVPLTGAISRVNQLQVHRFNFIADPDKTVDGFIAHEAQAVVPESVTGKKDAVDDDGNPIYQGIDQSKLVPLLTAALQEAIGRIETLEAEVAALKAQ
jgi:hypothetical protein